VSLTNHVALTVEGGIVPAAELTTVASALSKQVTRDFAPIWNVSATVDAFVRLEDVPVDYWPIIVQKDVQGAAGYHEDENGQPFAVVEFEPLWALTASHECLEMLADPYGRRLRSAPLADQAVAAGLKPSRVQYLIEVCDPCEDLAFAYEVNGVTVSDFYTPGFFDAKPRAGARYSFTGAIDAPRKVIDGGYVSWRDPASGHWLQLRMFPDNFSRHSPHVVDLTSEEVFGDLGRGTNLRAAIDRVTPHPRTADPGLRAAALAPATTEGTGSAADGRAARARMLRGEIERLRRP
jgi:hypothetical protein